MGERRVDRFAELFRSLSFSSWKISVNWYIFDFNQLYT